MASGDSLAVFHPYNNEPPDSNYATIDYRNRHPCLDFDPTTDEEAVFSHVMPQHYDGGGVTAYVHFAMSSAVADDIVWQGAFERIGDGQQDLDSDGFAAFQSSGAVEVPGTSGHVKICTITFTDGSQMDSVAVGESYRFKLRRDADSTSATDDAAGDGEMVKVELRET